MSNISQSQSKTVAVFKAALLKRRGDLVFGVFVMVLLAGLVGGCVKAMVEHSSRTPAESAAENSEMRHQALDTKYGKLRGNAEEVLQNYLLSSGDGMCDSLQNVRMGSIRYGTAVYQFAKREPAITGSYTADCIYYLMGDKISSTQTYWFRLTMQSSTGRREGLILLENQAEIGRGLQAMKFEAEF